jgi:hypothetical protein
VTLVAADLKTPKGELETFMFPDGSLDTRITAYLEEAEDKVADLDSGLQDDAARAWVYYRAYKAVCARLGGTPSQVTLDSGKTEFRYSGEQLKEFQKQRDFYLVQFNGYFADSPVGVAVGSINSPIPTGTIFN